MRLTCMRPLAGGASRDSPKLSHAPSTMPPSSTMPAGVCQIVIFSTSAAQQHAFLSIAAVSLKLYIPVHTPLYLVLWHLSAGAHYMQATDVLLKADTIASAQAYALAGLTRR